MEDTARKISLGLSPCPNDTFIFHALLHGLAGAPLAFSPVLADVEKLNAAALEGRLEVSKISLGAYPHIHEKYALLASGAALGWACGPLLVARHPMSAGELASASIAIPGRMTTANLLLDLHGGFHGKRLEMIFSDVIGAVAEGRADLGVIIHEGRFTYQKHNLCKILDLGQWWEDAFHMPLPLGAIAIRRDVPRDIALGVERAIGESLAYAWKNPEASAGFIRQNAQELEEEVTRRHIETFVTPFSRDLGPEGRQAIAMLMEKAMGQSAADIFLS